MLTSRPSIAECHALHRCTTSDEPTSPADPYTHTHLFLLPSLVMMSLRASLFVCALLAFTLCVSAHAAGSSGSSLSLEPDSFQLREVDGAILLESSSKARSHSSILADLRNKITAAVGLDSSSDAELDAELEAWMYGEADADAEADNEVEAEDLIEAELEAEINADADAETEGHNTHDKQRKRWKLDAERRRDSTRLDSTQLKWGHPSSDHTGDD